MALWDVAVGSGTPGFDSLHQGQIFVVVGMLMSARSSLLTVSAADLSSTIDRICATTKEDPSMAISVGIRAASFVPPYFLQVTAEAEINWKVLFFFSLCTCCILVALNQAKKHFATAVSGSSGRRAETGKANRPSNPGKGRCGHSSRKETRGWVLSSPSSGIQASRCWFFLLNLLIIPLRPAYLRCKNIPM